MKISSSDILFDPGPMRRLQARVIFSGARIHEFSLLRNTAFQCDLGHNRPHPIKSLLVAEVLGCYEELNIHPIRFPLLIISPTLIHQNAVTCCKVELIKPVHNSL
jgi:hypothetical protein